MRSFIAGMLLLRVSAQGPAGPWDAALVTLPGDIQESYNAHCLDGSTPGIYLRKGDPTRFKFHFQGVSNFSL